jgi:hypothetical protein
VLDTTIKGRFFLTKNTISGGGIRRVTPRIVAAKGEPNGLRRPGLERQKTGKTAIFAAAADGGPTGSGFDDFWD